MIKEIYHLFQAFGLELEYMIVDKDTLDVKPITDEVIKEVAGEYQNEVELDEINWSNELVLHVIELKTNGPAKSLDKLPQLFQSNVKHINDILAKRNAMLMPSAMHPWMDPHKEMKLWPHENSPIYDAYNRIFNCQGHGWANLQSTHINLPFADDEEFGRLHAAIRLVLPLIPALAASSPVADAKMQAYRDYRVEVYRFNQAKIPSIAGKVVPEAVFTEKDYRENILGKMYKDIAPYDKEGILQDEWLNSRGCIARFDRNTFEIRLIDIQECVKADIAIAAFIVEVLKALIEERWVTYEFQKFFGEDQLSDVLMDVVRNGESTLITDNEYLGALGVQDVTCSAIDVWKHLFNQVMNKPETAQWNDTIQFILDNGTLSSRIVGALEGKCSKERLEKIYRKLADCLAQNKQFDGKI